MKKAIGILLICVLLFGLTSCAGGMSVAPTTTELPTEPPLPEAELAANSSLEYLQSLAKTPEPLHVHETQHTSAARQVSDQSSPFAVSPQTGFGGMNREIYHLAYKSDGTVQVIEGLAMWGLDEHIDPERIGF